MLIPAIGIGSIFGIIPNEDSLKVFSSLGYPAYIVPFLSVAKLLGLIVDKDKGQDITLGMAFRLCHTLDVKLSDLVNGLNVKE
jgi:hypothetical protein